MTLTPQIVNSDKELLKPVKAMQATENKNANKPDKADQTSFAELLNERSSSINESKTEEEKVPSPGKRCKTDKSDNGCKDAKESGKEEYPDPSVIEKTSIQNGFITLGTGVDISNRQGITTIELSSGNDENHPSGNLPADRMNRSRSANVAQASVTQEEAQGSKPNTDTIKEPVLLSGHHHSAIDDDDTGKQQYSKGFPGERVRNLLTISHAADANTDVKRLSANNENDNLPDRIIKSGAIQQELFSADNSGIKIPQDGKASFINVDLQTDPKDDILLQKRQKSKDVFVERIADILRENGNGDSATIKMTSQMKNIVVSQDDKALPTFTSEESGFFSADTMKKKMTDSGNELHMDRGGTSTNSETQHVLPISGSGLATTKEAPAFHGLSVEAERDMIKTTTSKVKTVERVAGSIIMEPLSVVSSFSEKMNSLTNEATGLNAGAVIDQIADAKKQLDKDMSRIKITLNPPNLGTVDLEVTVRQNRVEVVMITDHSGVQQILQSHAEDMKSAMQRQDMKIDSYQVFLQNNTDGNQQQTNQWTAMHDQSGERHLQHFSEEDAPDTRFVSGDRSVQGSSGLVSIFA